MSTQLGVIEDVEVVPNWDDEPECDHSEHGNKPRMHAGPAVWAVTNECRGCHHIIQGLRCDAWRFWLLTTRGQVICNVCGQRTSNYQFYADSHWRKL